LEQSTYFTGKSAIQLRSYLPELQLLLAAAVAAEITTSRRLRKFKILHVGSSSKSKGAVMGMSAGAVHQWPSPHTTPHTMNAYNTLW